jgi:hypothetical protein
VSKQGYIQREFRLALDTLEEMPPDAIHTIPIRLDDCQIPEQFRHLQWSDLSEAGELDRIVQALRWGIEQRRAFAPEPALEPSPDPIPERNRTFSEFKEQSIADTPVQPTQELESSPVSQPKKPLVPDWKSRRASVVTIVSLVIAAVGALAAVIVVPEVRVLIGLDKPPEQPEANKPGSTLPLVQSFSSSDVSAESRLALVIGNGGYSKEAVLKTPPNDARLMADTLRALNFELFGGRAHIDVTQKQMRELIWNFATALAQRPKPVGLFYYSGQGMQVDNRNFILPVDAEIKDQVDVRVQGVSVDEEVLGRMSDANTLVNIVLLDACRNNPFEKRVKSFSASKGLGDMSAERGSIIGFASEPNTVAYESQGDYSYFTEALAREIVKPGTSITQVLGLVRRAVHDTTNGKQIPTTREVLFNDFYLLPTAASLPPLEKVPQNIEIVLDRSEAMSQPFAGRTKIKVATEGIAKKVSGPGAQHENLALRSFGGACEKAGSTKLEVDFAKNNGGKVSDAVGALTLSGQPTQAAALQGAISDFDDVRRFEGVSNRIVVISGSQDYCDPRKAESVYRRLKAHGIKPDFWYIAMDIPPDQMQDVKKLASATGGRFFPVRNQAEFDKAMERIFEIEPVISDISAVLKMLNGVVSHLNSAVRRVDREDYEGARGEIASGRTLLAESGKQFRDLDARQTRDIFTRLYQMAGDNRSLQRESFEITETMITARQNNEIDRYNTLLSKVNASIGRYNENIARIDNLIRSLR